MRTLLLVCLVACTDDDPVRLDPGGASPVDSGAPDLSWVTPSDVTDLAPELGIQGAFGSLQRGRACVSADFDGDGDSDVWVGNPTDDSFVRLNESEPGRIAFSEPMLVGDDEIWWGGASGDFDNDGDADLFAAGGGNELPWNDGIYFSAPGPDGLVMTDFADELGMASVPGELFPTLAKPHMSASAHVFDADNDGFLDIFVNSYVPVERIANDEAAMEDYGGARFWHNLGPGEYFADEAQQVGLVSKDSQQNSTSLDWDLDGDVDLYVAGFQGRSYFYENLWVDTGELRFVDVTDEVDLVGKDLHYPWQVFAAFSEDLNFDGYEDLVIFVRAFDPPESTFQDGHAVLLNVGGTGFVDVAEFTGINEPFVNWEQDTFRDHSGGGVMGSGLSDLNRDGIGDVFVGQGGPPAGTVNIQFVSSGLQEVDVPGVGPLVVPVWENVSEYFDLPAPADPTLEEVWPPYPYRTHGNCQVDFDRDGRVEMYEVNGGTSWSPDTVQEPDRLWSVSFEPDARWLSIGLTGDGAAVSRHAIGTRVQVTVERDEDGASWTITRWLKGGNGFSAQNGDDLFFGLRDADRIVGVEVRWPDGRVDHPEVPAMDAHVEWVY